MNDSFSTEKWKNNIPVLGRMQLNKSKKELGIDSSTEYNKNVDDFNSVKSTMTRGAIISVAVYGALTLLEKGMDWAKKKSKSAPIGEKQKIYKIAKKVVAKKALSKLESDKKKIKTKKDKRSYNTMKKKLIKIIN